MNKCYIIAGPGRTGSNLISNVLGNALGVPVLTDSTLNQMSTGTNVIHTHNPRLQLDPNACVILSHRHNLFDTVISSCIAAHYNEWTEYSSDQTPFTVDHEDFENRYVWSKRWYEAFDTYTTYHNKIAVEIETFMSDHTVLFDKIDIKYNATQPRTAKSPRSGSTVIINYHELTELFDKLEHNEFINTAPIHTFQWQYNE